MRMKRNKYGAIKTTIDGIKFDSKLEAKRWQELKFLQTAGKIKFLERQRKFPLIVNEKLICTYIADFLYCRGSIQVIEDVKGKITDVFRIKWKLLQSLLVSDVEVSFELWPVKKRKITTKKPKHLK